MVYNTFLVFYQPDEIFQLRYSEWISRFSLICNSITVVILFWLQMFSCQCEIILVSFVFLAKKIISLFHTKSFNFTLMIKNTFTWKTFRHQSTYGEIHYSTPIILSVTYSIQYFSGYIFRKPDEIFNGEIQNVFQDCS